MKGIWVGLMALQPPLIVANIAVRTAAVNVCQSASRDDRDAALQLVGDHATQCEAKGCADCEAF